MGTHPFALNDPAAYGAWREHKLAASPRSPLTPTVRIADAARLSDGERAALLAGCARGNWVVFHHDRGAITDTDTLRRLAAQLGLTAADTHLCADEDGVSAITRAEDGSRQARYVPYSNRPLSWHTDGYYNPPQHRIRSWLLHCVQDAAEGGENHLLDPDMLYIALRDEDPEHIAALMAPDALTIPANEHEEGGPRPAQTGPVFFVDPQTGRLGLRFSARRHNIVWKDDPLVKRAAQRINEILASDYPWIHTLRMSPGDGVISANALHDRGGYTDDPASGRNRLVYRIRFHDPLPQPG